MSHTIRLRPSIKQCDMPVSFFPHPSSQLVLRRWSFRDQRTLSVLGCSFSGNKICNIRWPEALWNFNYEPCSWLFVFLASKVLRHVLRLRCIRWDMRIKQKNGPYQNRVSDFCFFFLQSTCMTKVIMQMQLLQLETFSQSYNSLNSLFTYEVSKGQKIHKKFSAQRRQHYCFQIKSMKSKSMISA